MCGSITTIHFLALLTVVEEDEADRNTALQLNKKKKKRVQRNTIRNGVKCELFAKRVFMKAECINRRGRRENVNVTEEDRKIKIPFLFL